MSDIFSGKWLPPSRVKQVEFRRWFHKTRGALLCWPPMTHQRYFGILGGSKRDNSDTQVDHGLSHWSASRLVGDFLEFLPIWYMIIRFLRLEEAVGTDFSATVAAR